MWLDPFLVGDSGGPGSPGTNSCTLTYFCPIIGTLVRSTVKSNVLPLKKNHNTCFFQHYIHLLKIFFACFNVSLFWKTNSMSMHQNMTGGWLSGACCHIQQFSAWLVKEESLDRYYKMNSDMTAMARFLETLHLNELWSVVWSEVKNIYHLTNQVWIDDLISILDIFSLIKYQWHYKPGSSFLVKISASANDVWAIYVLIAPTPRLGGAAVSVDDLVTANLSIFKASFQCEVWEI